MRLWGWLRRRGLRIPDIVVVPAERLRDGDMVLNPGYPRWTEMLSGPTRVLPTVEPLMTRGQEARAPAINAEIPHPPTMWI